MKKKFATLPLLAASACIVAFCVASNDRHPFLLGGIQVNEADHDHWFDMLEQDDLVKIKGSEAIDIGEDEVGEKYSNMRDIKCPQCAQHMIPMVDKDQFHIKYESCPSCYGTFFDAGEFRDLKEYSVIKRFFSMLQTLRTNF